MNILFFFFVFACMCKFPFNTASLNIGLLDLFISCGYSWHLFFWHRRHKLVLSYLIGPFLLHWHFCPCIYSDGSCFQVTFIYYQFPHYRLFQERICLVSLFLSPMHVCAHTCEGRVHVGLPPLPPLFLLKQGLSSFWSCSLAFWLDGLASPRHPQCLSSLELGISHYHRRLVKSMPVLKIILHSLVRNCISIVLLFPFVI